MPVSLSKQARSELDDLLTAYVKPGLPGTVVSLVNRDGEQLYLGSSGPANTETNGPMKSDTVRLLIYLKCHLNDRYSPYTRVRRS
jgi:hypothetical protein